MNRNFIAVFIYILVVMGLLALAESCDGPKAHPGINYECRHHGNRIYAECAPKVD